MDFGPAPMEQLYTNATHPYFRAPHVYIALPKRFVPDRTALSEQEADRFGVHKSQRTAISELVFMTSRGGTRYDRTFMEALIRPGIDQQNWICATTWARGVSCPRANMKCPCMPSSITPSPRITCAASRCVPMVSLRCERPTVAGK